MIVSGVSAWALSSKFISDCEQKAVEAKHQHVPTRAAHMQSLKTETFDILIIGGGATGTGAALDAATRGLKTALVEREDFASGTSSRSTKLIHGGEPVNALPNESRQITLTLIYVDRC